MEKKAKLKCLQGPSLIKGKTDHTTSERTHEEEKKIISMVFQSKTKTESCVWKAKNNQMRKKRRKRKSSTTTAELADHIINNNGKLFARFQKVYGKN